MDFFLACFALVVFSPLLLIVTILIRVKVGSPVIFSQQRPGLIDPKTGQERVFKMYKFRTMTDQRDESGNLLPDSLRMTSFGEKMRSSSLDELIELINIIKGDMAVIGPRPQLVRDMVFMTDEQRMRHTVRPGLSGLAQISGRNTISWDGKLSTDLKYIDKITFLSDAKIVLQTMVKVFKREGITEEGAATATDYGDYLLETGRVSKEEYDKKQAEALHILEKK